MNDLDVRVQVLLCPKALFASDLGAREWARRSGEVRARVRGEMGIAEIGFGAGGACIWALDARYQRNSRAGVTRQSKDWTKSKKVGKKKTK